MIDRLIVRPSTADGPEPPASTLARQCGPLSSRWPTTREHYATALRTGIDADLGFVELASARRSPRLPSSRHAAASAIADLGALQDVDQGADGVLVNHFERRLPETFASPSVAINSLRAEVIHGLRQAPSAGLTRPIGGTSGNCHPAVSRGSRMPGSICVFAAVAAPARTRRAGKPKRAQLIT